MFAEIIIALVLGLLILESLLVPLSGIIKAIHEIKPDKASVIECTKVTEIKGWKLEKCSMEKKNEMLRLSGFTILEFLGSTFIALVVITVSMNSLGAVSIHAKNAEIRLAEITVSQRADAEIERIFRFSEQNPLGLSPITHPKGLLKLADATLNKVHTGNIKLQPAGNSMALSNISLDFISGLKVQKCSVSGKNYQGRACLKTASTLAEYKSYLLYSLDGYQEAIGTVSGNGKCRDFNVEAADGIYFKSISNLNKCNLIYVIPIKSLQSIYISKQGDLRLITHRTIENAENQPLTKTFSDIKLNLRAEANYLSWDLSLGAKIIGRRNLPRAFESVSELSFFMNLL